MNQKKPALDIHTRIGVLAILLLISLVSLGGIKNALSYSNSYDNLIGPSYFVLNKAEEGIGQVGEGSQEAKEKAKKPDIPVCCPKNEIGEFILKYSEEYQVSPYLVTCIIQKESNFNSNAVGSAGEQGLCQFKLGTWRSFRRQMGEDETISPFNPEEAVKTLAWALSRGYAGHWSVLWRCQ